MASKKYISIIRLLDHCGVATGDDFNLSRTKKQLQAEFGIALDGFIEVGGHTYTRQDIFEELERPDFAKRLVYHQRIYEAPQVLQLMEENSVNFLCIGDELNLFTGDPDFDEFFSPYFAHTFGYLSRGFLSGFSMEDLSELLRYEGFLLPAEREEAFRPIRIFLDENLRILRNVTGENYKMMRRQIAGWIDTDWHGFFDQLPGEFYEEKTDIATKLINIGVSIQKSNRSDCKKMSAQLVALSDMPQNLRSTIVTNHSIYTGAGTKSWRGGFWMVWVMIMILKGVFSGGCGDTERTYQNFTPLPIQYMAGDSILKKTSDSGAMMRRRDSLLKDINQPHIPDKNRVKKLQK